MLALESGGGGIGGDGGADIIFPFFIDGVLLSQKTHGLLLASVSTVGDCFLETVGSLPNTN